MRRARHYAPRAGCALCKDRGRQAEVLEGAFKNDEELWSKVVYG